MPRSTRRLQTLPGIGPSLAEDLLDLGFREPADLRGRDPERMYADLCDLRRRKIDRCVLYAFRCAVHAATEGSPEPELRKWWNWKDIRVAGAGAACEGCGAPESGPEESRSASFDELYGRVENVFGAEPEPILRTHCHRLDRSGPILDVGAGQGRNALFLAREGFTVHALEPSEVAVDALSAAASREGLALRTFRCGFEGFDPPETPCSGILLFGLIPILRPEAVGRLLRAIARWSREGSLLFVTAFSVADPAYERHSREWERIGKNAFADGRGGVRTYLEPDEILEWFDGFEAIHHREGMGPEHRHGDGPAERHAMVEAVLRRRPGA